MDLGFVKYGFDRTVRRSFIDILDQIRNHSPRFKFFLPCRSGDQYCDRNFNAVASYQPIPPSPRHRARTANTSAVTCTKARWHFECTFAREWAFQITGTRKEVPQQYMMPSTINGFESQPNLNVWLLVVDVISRNYSTPFHLSYPVSQYDDYYNHGTDLRNRLEMENCLSDFSNIAYRRDIFKKPLLREIQPRGIVALLDIFTANQTEFPQFTERDLASVTLGSFQNQQTHSYITKIRNVAK